MEFIISAMKGKCMCLEWWTLKMNVKVSSGRFQTNRNNSVKWTFHAVYSVVSMLSIFMYARNPLHVSIIAAVRLCWSHLCVLCSRSWTLRAKIRTKMCSSLNSASLTGMAWRAAQFNGSKFKTLRKYWSEYPQPSIEWHTSNHTINWSVWVIDLPFQSC